MKSHIVTIVEGHYNLGLGALANSLAAAGFAGTVSVFGRAEPPDWAGLYNRQIQTAGVAIVIDYRQIASDMHLSVMKAQVMQKVFETTDADLVFYFDPDIVVLASWPFYERWAEGGVALVEDGNYGTMPADHPHRLAWAEQLEKLGLPPVRLMSRYYNSGFVGIRREHAAFLGVWDRAMMGIAEEVDLRHFKPGSREDPYFGTDQDTLNMATMASDQSLSTIGPEGMALEGWGYVMVHAVAAQKPWRRRHLREALRGNPPSLGDQSWLRFTGSPIRVLTPGQAFRAKASMKIAQAIGRFYRR